MAVCRGIRVCSIFKDALLNYWEVVSAIVNAWGKIWPRDFRLVRRVR